MARYLKQSTAATIVIGPFVDESDGRTAETGLTIAAADIQLSKNGGAFGNANAAATHMANGYYSNVLSTGNTDTLGRLVVTVNESGALPVRHDYMVLPANVYDSLVGGSDVLQVDVIQWEGTDATNTSATWESANYPSGTAQAATANTLTLASSDDTPSDHYIGSLVFIESGTGYGQARRIIDNTFHASTPTITVDPDWATNPSTDSVYSIYPAGLDKMTNLDAAVSSRSTFDSATNAVTVEAMDANAVSAILGSVLSDTPRSDGAAATLEQALVELMVALGLTKLERSGTTLTGYKFNESTTYKTWTLDSATNPTSRTSAS